MHYAYTDTCIYLHIRVNVHVFASQTHPIAVGQLDYADAEVRFGIASGTLKNMISQLFLIQTYAHIHISLIQIMSTNKYNKYNMHIRKWMVVQTKDITHMHIGKWMVLL